MSINLYIVLTFPRLEKSFTPKDVQLTQLKLLIFDISNDLNHLYNSSMILERNGDNVTYGAKYCTPIRTENLTPYLMFREGILRSQGMNGSIKKINKTFIFGNNGYFMKNQGLKEAYLVSPNVHWKKIKIVMSCPDDNATTIEWNVEPCSSTPDPTRTLTIFNYSDITNSYSQSLWCDLDSDDNIKIHYNSTNITFYLKENVGSMRITKMIREGDVVECEVVMTHTIENNDVFYGYYGVILNLSHENIPSPIYVINNKV